MFVPSVYYSIKCKILLNYWFVGILNLNNTYNEVNMRY